MLGGLTSSAYSAASLGLTLAEQNIVLDVYMDGLRYSFIFYTVCTAIGFVLSLGIGNTRLDKGAEAKNPDEESQQTGGADQESGDAEMPGEGVVKDTVGTSEKVLTSMENRNLTRSAR